ncbi:MAG: PAS domain S-box protein [Desulfobacterales bacterium]|nr:PAS domain S-box protein [Desulfobacterales bacterium]
MNLIDKNIIKKYLVIMVAIISSIVFLYTGIMTFYKINKQNIELKEQFVQTINYIESSAQSKRIDFSKIGIQEFVGSILLNNSFVFIKIALNNAILVKNTPKYTEKQFLFFQQSPKFIAQHKDILLEDKKIGSIELVMTREQIFREMLYNFYFSLFLTIILSITMFITSYLFINKYILSRVKVLKKSIDGKINELDENKKKYQELTELLPQTVWEFDLKGNITYLNSKGLEMFGYTKKDLEIGIDVKQVFAPGEFEKSIENAKKILTEKSSSGNEYLSKRKDGSLFNALVYSAPIMKDGKLIGWRGTSIDITESIKLRNALKKSEERFRTMVESTSDWIWELNKDMKYSYASPKIFDILGYKPNEVIDKTPFDLMPKDECSKIYETFSKIVENKESFHNLENVNIHKNGEKIILETSGIPFFDGQGNLIGYRGIDRDITDRKKILAELEEAYYELNLRLQELLKTKAALNESEKNFRKLIEKALIGISIIQDKRILYKNPEFENIMSPILDEQEQIKFEMIHPDDIEKVQNIKKELINENIQTLDTDFRFFISYSENDLNPKMRWIQYRAALINYQNKKGVLMNVIDITRMKELEYMMRIEDKMSSLGRVTAGISHEIRNPLSGINMYLKALSVTLNKSAAIEPDYLDKSNKIINQLYEISDKIESIIKKVLDFSRQSTPKKIPANINQTIEQTIELTKTSIRKANISINKDLSPDLPILKLDNNMFEQVFINLINNAINALKKIDTHKIIEIKTLVKNKDVYIIFADSGPGIPVSMRKKIFDPFFTTQVDGMGIGLSLSHRIVIDHGGSLDAKTSKYGGAEFIIKLPIIE